ncbi:MULTISPECIES: hypothetical protein [Prauserella salsuginis group]|uniref:DUF2637 domain-containing protein n=1 Tax=Prauserella salsuginis TaxID=387889 RepID=A0ABW6G280_9PSEU|nr:MULTISPECIES: hypothetical protein [Prauserella salsuginis group]MCR3719926.1 hypothetical protein [Prauserella flava]MCR3736530.1 hypothetical protein [Prauserella salsuginis]
MSWAELREQKRADRQAEAEQARLDADAAAERRIRQQQARAEQQRREAEQVAEQRRQAKAEASARRADRWRALRGWAAEHVVRLLIWPLALVSAVMAVPAMAEYGLGLYAGATGLALPILTELGMWAFALAVEVSRKRTPGAPVWALQLGVWVFAGVNFTLNVLHGLDRGWSAGAAMGLVSVAGVIAHQLTVAGPRRTPAERREATLARQVERKCLRVRRAAVRQAPVALDEHGTATVVYAPGRYVLTGHGRRLESAIDPTPADSTSGVPAGDPAWDVALADLIADAERQNSDHEESTPDSGGGVATLDVAGDQQESRADRGPIRGRVSRTLDQLRAEFTAAIEAGELDPTSAESIRKALRCAPKYARQLRDEHQRGEAR